MKLQEFTETKQTQQIAKVFESYFGSSFQFDKLTHTQAKALLSRVRGALNESRRRPDFHRSEQNPAYLKMMMLEQALGAVASAPGAATAAPAAGTAPQVDPAKAAALQTAQQQQKKRQIQDQIKMKQKEIADLQKAMNSPMAMAEQKLLRAYRMLKESEVQQAQVVLAAQDMVDKMQGMLEDVSELQFKELPALVDSIKNQVGVEQSQQFNNDATAALTGLLQNIQGAKAQLDQALGVVTGQAPAVPGVPGMDVAAGAEAGADLGAEAAGAAGADLGAEAGADLAAADFGGEEEEPAGAAELGRGRR